MTKQKGIKDFTIDDLDYGADDYEKNVNAYLTRNENKKGYYNPRRVSKKQNKVPEVPPVSNTVDVMLANLRNRIKDEEALADTRPDLVSLKTSEGIGSIEAPNEITFEAIRELRKSLTKKKYE